MIDRNAADVYDVAAASRANHPQQNT